MITMVTMKATLKVTTAKAKTMVMKLVGDDGDKGNDAKDDGEGDIQIERSDIKTELEASSWLTNLYQVEISETK